MKTAPVYHALRSANPDTELLLVHTGQHYDDEMSEVFLQDLGLPQPDFFLAAGSGTHARQTARALEGVEQVLLERRPDVVVVPGDVNSTLAAALAAAKLQIPVAHVEAGLRSFDARMPEEHNRRLTDHLSTILLCHSESAIENLKREGIDAGTFLVGNTMIDSLLQQVESALAGEPWRALEVEPGRYALVTLHRPNLVDSDEPLRTAVEALITLARTMQVVFPLHPRTRERLEALDLLQTLVDGGVTVTGPLGYRDFLGLEARARLVITDSGGVQEETSALGVPCFTLRDTTERPITVEQGTNVVLGEDPRRLREIPDLASRTREPCRIPLWDGKAGPRAAEVLLRFLSEPRESGARAGSADVPSLQAHA